MDTVIRIEHLSKELKKRLVVDDLSLEVYRGDRRGLQIPVLCPLECALSFHRICSPAFCGSVGRVFTFLFGRLYGTVFGRRSVYISPARYFGLKACQGE